MNQKSMPPGLGSKMIMRRFLPSLLSLIVVLSFFPSVTHAVTSEALLDDLRDSPPYQQGSIYRTINQNSEVLSDTELRREILNVVRNYWYEEFIRKPVLVTDGEVDVKGDGGLVRTTIKPLQALINKMPPGPIKTKTILWIQSNPGAGIYASPGSWEYIKQRGPEALAFWLKKVNYQTGDTHYRLLSSEFITQPLFEGYLQYGESVPQQVNTATKNFCEKNIREPEDSGMTKNFCVAYLHENGLSYDQIRQKLNFQETTGEKVWPMDEILNAIVDGAKKWKEEYPKWDVEPVSVDSFEVPDLSELVDNKVTICHIPPGNPAARHTIEIGRPALQAHLNHGDKRGKCQSKGRGKGKDKGPSDKKGPPQNRVRGR
jgi:hypothetical protein